jgi:predicted MPP superfamily phosphohydrolase
LPARLLLFLLAIALAVLTFAYGTAISEPRVRATQVELRGLPNDAPPIRMLLLSDIHVAGPDMPPERLARIIRQARRLRPDIVLIAGDFVSDKHVRTRSYSFVEAVAPLSRLGPPLGTFAVLGNHDHWRNSAEARSALAGVGIRVLDNDAVRAGPLAIGGVDDAFTGRADVAGTMTRLRRIGGVPLLLSHSPDPFPQVPRSIALMLAGHTHCGQIRLPLVGAISTMSDYGDRYACGVIREDGKTLVVSAGLGTSLLPLRLGAVPDMWLLRLVPPARR